MPGYEVGMDKLQCNPKIYSPKVAVESCLSTWTCPNLASRRRNEERKSSFVRKTKTTKPIRIEFLAGDNVEIPLVFPLFFCCLFHRRVCDHIAGGSGLGWWLRSLYPFLPRPVCAAVIARWNRSDRTVRDQLFYPSASSSCLSLNQDTPPLLLQANTKQGWIACPTAFFETLGRYEIGYIA